jgi:hypothetical protein
MPTVQIKFPHNVPVPSNLTLVEGNRLRVKIEAVAKAYKLAARADAPAIILPQEPSHNARADSWQFDFTARQAGLAKISIVAVQGTGLSVTPAAITVQVEKAIALPAENTTEGMLVRLLLAENPSPGDTSQAWKLEDVKTAMQWMRRVIDNRLRSGKTEDFMARGASRIEDIIQADDRGSVQFHGFNLYPNLGADITRNLGDYVNHANNGLHPKRKAYLDFVQAAIDVATGPLPPDPTPNGLFAWRTAGSGSPGADFIQHAALARNMFYTHARLRKRD